MHPIHDADVLLLLAITIASKRKPAMLDEVVVALGMIQPRLPGETKILDAFGRLSSHGLILARDEGFTLSNDAEKTMASLPKKGDTAERVHNLKEKLSAYAASATHVAVQPSAADLDAAIIAWRASLPPPTKTEVHEQRKERQKELGREANSRPKAGPGGFSRPRTKH